jgi:hypothetical protein
MIPFAAPQIADSKEPFRSEIRQHLKGRTEALEDLAVELLARGLSVRDIEDAFKDESGRLLLSKTAVSEIGALPLGARASKSSTTRGRPWVMSSPATPPVWKVRIVSWVPGSPMDWAAMMPTASPMSTSLPVASERP